MLSFKSTFSLSFFTFIKRLYKVFLNIANFICGNVIVDILLKKDLIYFRDTNLNYRRNDLMCGICFKINKFGWMIWVDGYVGKPTMWPLKIYSL